MNRLESLRWKGSRVDVGCPIEFPPQQRLDAAVREWGLGVENF